MWAIVGSFGVAAVLGIVVYYLRRAYQNSVALSQSEAALQAESEHSAALEKAAEAARAARAKELDVKVANVRTGADAADLLRSELSRA